MDKTILDIIIKAKDEASSTLKKTSSNMSQMGKTAEHIAAGASVALIGIATVSVKMAATFQESMTQLVTGAGESEKNIKMVSAGILQLAVATGTSTQQLSAGMYMIESAGFHGAAGLKVLKAAAEGAKVGNASLGTVSNALTSILNAYHISVGNATNVTNEMVATVAAGKMHMQDLANAISAVLPVAAAAHVSFAQVGGAIATMTAQGMSAQQASQDLAHTIRALQAPNAVAVNEMQQLGLSSNQVAMNLGKKGLTGTIQLLTQTITQHMGKNGEVIMNAFNQSKSAAQDANIMISQMPGSIQSLARAYMNGSTSMAQWRLEMQMATPLNRNLMQQFGTLANKSKGFNSLLKSGLPAAQTYTAALSKMMGGATGLNTALMLGGSNMPNFTANVATVAAAAKKGGQNVHGWSLVQKDFNFKMDQAKEALNTTGIAIGTALLPPLTYLLKAVLKVVRPIAEWTSKHEKLTAILLGSITTMLGITAAILKIHSAISKIKEAYTIFKEATIAIKSFSIWSKIAMIAQKVWTGVQIAFNAVMDANPIALVVLAIAGLVVAAYAIIKNWKKVTTWFKTYWPLLAPIILGPFGIALDLITGKWKIFPQMFEKIWKKVGPIVSKWGGDLVRWIGSGISQTGSDLVQWGSDLVKYIKRGWKRLVSNSKQWAKDLVKDIERGLLDLASYDISSLIKWSKDFSKAIQWGKSVIKNVIKGLVDGLRDVARWGKQIYNDIKYAISRIFPDAYGWGKNIIHNIVNGAVAVVKDIVQFFRTLPQLLSSHAKKAGENIATAHLNGIKNVIKNPSEMKKIGQDILMGLGIAIAAVLGGIIFLALSIGIAIVNGIIAGFKFAGKLLWKGLSDAFSAIGRFFSGAGSWLFNTGKWLIMGFVNGVNNFANVAVNTVKNVASNVVKGFKNLLGIHSPSTVFAEAGRNIGAGLVVGLQQSAMGVKTAVNGLVPTTINPKITGAANSSVGTTNAQHVASPQAAGSGMSFSVGAMTVNIHGYAGTQSDKQKVAVEIWQSLMQVARSHNMAGNVPNLGIRPV